MLKTAGKTGIRDAAYARAIMRAYARCTATQASIASMRSDIKRQGNELSKDTVDSYIAAPRNLYVIEDLDAWAPSLHAKSRIATTPVRHFSDPSVAVAALGTSPASQRA